MVAYTTFSNALARAKERTSGYATDANDQLLTDLLQMSAAKDLGGNFHYRPFLVAALFLEQSPEVQLLEEADDAVFTGLKIAIASLRELQSAYDHSNQLVISSGFEAIKTEAGQSTTLPFPTTNYRVRTTF